MSSTCELEKELTLMITPEVVTSERLYPSFRHPERFPRLASSHSNETYVGLFHSGCHGTKEPGGRSHEIYTTVGCLQQPPNLALTAHSNEAAVTEWINGDSFADLACSLHDKTQRMMRLRYRTNERTDKGICNATEHHDREP